MVNFVSPFSACALITTFAAACTDHAETIAVVNSQSYVSKECWVNEDGIFEAFLVTARDGETIIPYVVSRRCEIDGGYTSYGEAIVHHIDAVRLVDDREALQRYFPGEQVSSIVVTDQPMPQSDSNVYLFRASVRRVADESREVFSVENVVDLRRLATPFEEFLGLSRSARESLWASRGPN